MVEAADSEGVHAWRTGVLSCLRKRLNNQDLLEDLRVALHATLDSHVKEAQPIDRWLDSHVSMAVRDKLLAAANEGPLRPEQ